MSIAYWCILVAALLPLGLVAYAKSSSRDNNAPRDAADRLTGEKRRAYAAHQNAYENFPFFAIAVVSALAFGDESNLLNGLAVAYVLLRIAHAALYIRDIASARSVAYILGLLINIAIFALPAFQ